jgi:hypothetical protein
MEKEKKKPALRWQQKKQIISAPAKRDDFCFSFSQCAIKKVGREANSFNENRVLLKGWETEPFNCVSSMCTNYKPQHQTRLDISCAIFFKRISLHNMLLCPL